MSKKVVDYFNGDELAASVWDTKYKAKDELTPDDSIDRVVIELINQELENWKEFKVNSTLYSNLFNDLSEEGKEFVNRLIDLDDAKFGETLYRFWKPLLSKYRFIIPGGSIMEALGTDRIQSLSNCFFNGAPEDNLEDIMDIVTSMAQVGKRRGGSAMDLSNLRPRGASINNAAKESTGATSWMYIADTVGKVIGQNNRKMAMMLSIDAKHPDVFDFINIKRNNDQITNANISAKLSYDLYFSAINNEDYILRWPINLEKKVPEILDKYHYEKGIYNQLYPVILGDKTIGYTKRVKARELWDLLVKNSRDYAEPGIFNWDRIISFDPTSVYPELKPEGTNPCGELPLAKNDSCRLLHTNVYNLVDYEFTNKATWDRKEAYSIFYQAQWIIDLIVDLEVKAIDRILNKIDSRYIIEENQEWKEEFIEDSIFYNLSKEFLLWWEIREKGRKGRRTGTGITGLGDFYAALGLPYGHLEVTKELFDIKLRAELDASIDKAILLEPFPLWDRDKEYRKSKGSTDIINNTEFELVAGVLGTNDWYKFIFENYPKQFYRMYHYGRRNSGISTIAPVGSGSIVSQVTSGIEPLFAPYYKRRKTVEEGVTPDFVENGRGYTEYLVVHQGLKDFALFNGLVEYDYDNSPEKSLEFWEEVFKKSPYYNNTAEDISYINRVELQGLIQRYITASISSTVNLPNDVSIETVDEIYQSVFKYGLKGITIYRDGSRGGVLIKEGSSNVTERTTNNAPKRPKVLEADYYEVKSKGTKYIILVGLLGERPYEIFAFLPNKDVNIENHRGKITKVKKGQYAFDSEFINIADLELFNDKHEERMHTMYTSFLLRHEVPIPFIIKTIKKMDGIITSFSSAMSRVLRNYITKDDVVTGKCPSCGGDLVYDNGCMHCTSCGEGACE